MKISAASQKKATNTTLRHAIGAGFNVLPIGLIDGHRRYYCKYSHYWDDPIPSKTMRDTFKRHSFEWVGLCAYRAPWPVVFDFDRHQNQPPDTIDAHAEHITELLTKYHDDGTVYWRPWVIHTPGGGWHVITFADHIPPFRGALAYHPDGGVKIEILSGRTCLTLPKSNLQSCEMRDPHNTPGRTWYKPPFTLSDKYLIRTTRPDIIAQAVEYCRTQCEHPDPERLRKRARHEPPQNTLPTSIPRPINSDDPPGRIIGGHKWYVRDFFERHGYTVKRVTNGGNTLEMFRPDHNQRGACTAVYYFDTGRFVNFSEHDMNFPTGEAVGFIEVVRVLERFGFHKDAAKWLVEDFKTLFDL